MPPISIMGINMINFFNSYIFYLIYDPLIFNIKLMDLVSVVIPYFKKKKFINILFIQPLIKLTQI